MLGAAPEMCWGLDQQCVITFPPVDDPQKNNKELIFNLLNAKTKPTFIWGLVSSCCVANHLSISVAGDNKPFFFLLMELQVSLALILVRLSWVG